MKINKWLPGTTIGVLGGGQLGRMTILEGRKMGYRFITLDPTIDCPGAQVADDHIVAQYDDPKAAEELAKRSDLIIYEFENIDPQIVEYMETLTSVPQGSRLLRFTRHRLQEKKEVEAAGVAVTPYREIINAKSLRFAIADIGLPAVLKTTTGGYDGKGQWMLRTPEDVDKLLMEQPFMEKRSFILEQFVPFVKELSVVVARSTKGEMRTFSPTVNLHRQHILHLSLAPAPLEPEVEARAMEMAKKIAAQIEVVGLLAVEMFLLADGTLLVNELAPRPHNSGHHTYNACQTSQFEQFIRAVLGLPLHDVALTQPVAMVNLLGEHVESFMEKIYQLPSYVKVHWYGKSEAKTGRKMGHLSVLGESSEQVIRRVEQLSIWSELDEQEKQALSERI